MALIIAATLTGCVPDPPQVPTPTPAASSAAGTALPSGTAVPPPSNAELEPALLTVKDLGADYRVMPMDINSAGGIGAGVEQCGSATVGETPQIAARVEAGFHRPPLGPFLAEVITALSPDGAHQTMAAFRRAIENCGQFGVPGGIEVRLAQLTLPPIGDDMATLRLTATIGKGAMSLYGHLVAVRHRDLVVLLTVMRLDPPQASETERIVRQAVAKVATIRR